MVSIIFVCLGNICRSPAAQGVFQHLIYECHDEIEIEVASCGIGDWHVGQLPDPRMREAASERGIILTSRAQQFNSKFLDEYDYILASDNEVLSELYLFAKEPHHKAKVKLITHFSKSYPNEEIPDPYYGGSGDFHLVLDMLEDACEGLIEEIKKGSK